MSDTPLTCPVCEAPADRICSGCHSVSYCSSGHQKAHWKQHKRVCRPFIVKRNDIYGRYLVAARDLEAGSIVMTESPVTVGPKRASFPICLGCYSRVNGEYLCSQCTFPMCGEKCEKMPIHTENECPIFSRGHPIGSRIKNFSALSPAYEAVTVLRCLLLKDRDSQAWNKLNSMEAHNEIRRANTSMWNTNHVNVVTLLRNWCRMSEEFDERTIHSVIGYVDVNAFEIKTNVIEICGVYPEASLMSHSCVPNTHHATTTSDKAYRMIVRTSVPVPKGTMLTTSYADHLKGTEDRRQFLINTKFFECMCDRCADPAEIGTFMSAIKCSACPPGYILPAKPLSVSEEAVWKCYEANCSNKITADKVKALLTKISKDVETVDKSTAGSRISRLERLLKKYSGKVLHPNHYILVDIIKTLSVLYSVGVVEKDDESPTSNGKTAVAGKETLQRKRELCLILLSILDKIDPGLSRHRGVTLYHLFQAEFFLYKGDHENGELSNGEYKQKLEAIHKYLETAKNILGLDRLLIEKPRMSLAVDEAVDTICDALNSIHV